MICIWFYFCLKKKIGLFLVISVFVFSSIFNQKKKKSVALARVLSQSSLCYFYLKNSIVFHAQLLCTCTLAT